jgi:hypothetical protein
MKSRIKTIETLPKELTRSAPRPVAYTIAGKTALASIPALVVAAIVSGVLLNQSLAREEDTIRLLQTEGRTAEARIVKIEQSDGENKRPIVSYSFVVDGREYSGSKKLKKRDRGKFVVGSRAPVRYLASRPESSWIEGYGPGAAPTWVAAAVPGAMLLCIVPIVIYIRRQARLLAEGRAALARVTKTHKVKYGDHNTWRIEYEWTVLSGALRSGRYDQYSRPPAVGARIPVLYDRDNPKRNAPYPLSLVKAAQ